MRKDYIVSGLLTLIWFVGMLGFLWFVGIEGGIALLSFIVLSVVFFGLGVLLPEKKGS